MRKISARSVCALLLAICSLTAVANIPVQFNSEHLTISSPEGYSIATGDNINSTTSQLGYGNIAEYAMAFIFPMNIDYTEQSSETNGVASPFGMLYKLNSGHVQNPEEINVKEWISTIERVERDYFYSGKIELLLQPTYYSQSNSYTLFFRDARKYAYEEYTICYALVIFPGKEATYYWKLYFPYHQKEKAADLCSRLATEFSFDDQYSYSDFVYEQRELPTTSNYHTAVLSQYNDDSPESKSKNNILKDTMFAGEFGRRP